MFKPVEGSDDHTGFPRALESVVGFSLRKTQFTVLADCPIRLDVAQATLDQEHGSGLLLRNGSELVGFLKLESPPARSGLWRASVAEGYDVKYNAGLQSWNRQVKSISDVLVG